MVAFTSMGWLSDMGFSLGVRSKRSDPTNQPARLGILSFETAKTMSRLLSLYNSLSDCTILDLKKAIIKSEGVAYLNSRDEGFLLSLACAERLEELDKAASAVARLGHKCSDFGLNRFDIVYNDLKLGIIDLGKLEYGEKETEKRIQKMKTLISSTSSLYSALENLTELEIAEQKLKNWKRNNPEMQSEKTNFDHFYQKIGYQRKQVRHFRETSLWSQTFDKSVGLMARIICIVYARLCALFSPYIPSQKTEKIKVNPEFCFIDSVKEQMKFRSGPITQTTKPSLVRFYSRKSILFSSDDSNSGGSRNRVFHAAAPSTVGGAGLAVRYANVILLAERYLDTEVTIGDEEREALYQMLPENLKSLVRAKLSRNAKSTEDDELLAEGWREGLRGIMGWLAPMARDTMTWQMERNFEKTKFEWKPTTLLLQTLHFSDKVKAEAAIAEVLVGLSCICMHEHRRS